MIDLSQQKHFAIQHVHNVTGFFTTQFEAIKTGEPKLNISSEGVTFFRMSLDKKPEEQAEWMQQIDISLSDFGGLDGVIIFDDQMGSTPNEGVAISEEIKKSVPRIRTVLIGEEKEEPVSSNVPDFFIASSDSKRNFINALGINSLKKPLSNEQQNLFNDAARAVYADTCPKLLEVDNLINKSKVRLNKRLLRHFEQ